MPPDQSKLLVAGDNVAIRDGPHTLSYGTVSERTVDGVHVKWADGTSGWVDHRGMSQIDRSPDNARASNNHETPDQPTLDDTSGRQSAHNLRLRRLPSRLDHPTTRTS